MFTTIAALGLGFVTVIGATTIVKAIAEAPEKRRARFEQRLARFQSKHSFAKLAQQTGYPTQSRLQTETVIDYFGRKVHRVVFEATLKPDQKPFPFSLELIPHHSPERRSTLNRECVPLFQNESMTEQMAPQPWSRLDGNAAVFWAVLDGPLRAWLKKTKIKISDRTLRAVLTDAAQSNLMNDRQFTDHISQQLALAQTLIDAVQQNTFTTAMARRLAEHPHQKERLHMLDTWLRAYDPQSQPPADFSQFNDCRHPEFWMFFLENGGDPPPAKRDLCFAQQEPQAQKILLTIIRRQPEARCKEYALAALNWPAFRIAAAETLTRFEDQRLFPTLINAYRQKPHDQLLDLIAQHQDPAIVALMLDLLKTGPRNAILPAIEYLSRFGDRSALAPIINARNEVPLLSQGKWEQAVNRLRRRLGPAPEAAGALSSVTPDPMQGSLERADQGGQLTTPEA